MNVSLRTSTNACYTTTVNKNIFAQAAMPSIIRWFFVFAMFALSVTSATAQTISATTYPMTTASGVSLVDMSTGTTQLVVPNVDDNASAVFNIGFDFWFNGTRYTQFSANANGLARLGATAVSTAFTNSLTDGANEPKLAPYWDDLWTGTNGQVHYKVTGSAPNRILVVEWQNEQIPRGGSGASGAGTFQMWLSETSGIISYVYGSGIITNSANSGYSIGFSASATVYASVTTTTNTVSYATANNTQTNSITSGTQYSFTPISSLGAASSLTFANVGLTSMTLDWAEPGSTAGIVRYAVYGSTDGGTTYNYYGQTNVGTSILTVGNLLPNTNYTWRIYSVSEGAIGASFPEDQQATSACSFAGGTFSVGPTGTYASITQAEGLMRAAGITGPVILELASDYVSSVETFPLKLRDIPCASSTNTITIRPAAGATVSITSNNTTATLSLDSADYYIIDGRQGGTGAIGLTVSNTSTGAAVRFINDATNNVVKYITATSGATSTTSGIVVFSTAITGGTGNDNNTIDNCDLNGNGVNANIIYASGTSTVAANNNSGITISNNKIHDQFVATSATHAINVSSGNTEWTISGNSFYQSATRTFTASNTQTAIFISNSSGNNFIVSGNFIGGTAANAGGTPMNISGSGTFATRFRAISMSVGTTTPSSVQGNTITNMTYKSSSGSSTVGGPWVGIYVSAGSVNIGTVTGNTIGAATGTGAISDTVTSSTGISSGIFIDGGSTHNIANNIIGGINVVGSSTSISHGFTGIHISSATTTTTNNNTIGSISTANSINSITAATGTGNPTVTGILHGSGTGFIYGNTIANLNSAYVPAVANTATQMRGIWASSGRDSIAGNTVRNLTVASNGTGSANTASVIGIGNFSGTTGANYIRNNTVHSLSNNNATAAVHVTGIYFNGPATGPSMIDRNLVYGITTPSSIGFANGINAGGTTAVYQNNMVRLGEASTATNYNGILETAGINSFWHNTVFIGGSTASTAAVNTYAFNNNVTVTSVRNIRNNIFINERSNATTGGKHYSFRNNGTITGLTINNNLYRATGTGAQFGSFNGADVANLAAWKVATGQDAQSIDTNPCLAAPAAAVPDLHLTDCALAGSPADGVGFNMGVINDYDNQTRADFSPVDLGADAGYYGAIGSDVGLSALVLPAAPTGCYTATETVTVTVKNYGINLIDFAINPVTVTVTVTGAGAYSSNIVVNTGTLAPNGTLNVTLPATIDMTAPGTYIFNGSAVVAGDVNAVNDVLPVTNRVNNSMGGSYTVGTGGNFTTLTAAVAAFNTATCITAPIIFNLTNLAPYNAANGETYPLTINSALTTTINTLTIKPAATVTTTLSGSATTAMIRILGRNVIIDGSNNGTSTRDLTITNTSVTTPSVVLIGSTGTTPITNVTVKNSIIINGVNTSSAVVVSDATALGAAGYFNNITIQNNSVQKAFIGVYAIAVVTAGNGSGYTLTGNNLDATGLDAIRNVGLYLQGIDGATVSNNTIGNFSNLTAEVDKGVWMATEVKNSSITGNTISNLDGLTSNASGIYLTSTINGANINLTNNTISGITGSGTGTTAGISLLFGTGGFNMTGNKISGITNTSAGGGSATGILLNTTSITANTLVANNFIYDVTGNGGINNGNGISVITGAGYNIYNNTISLATNQTTAGTTAALSIAATVVDAGALNVRNNIFSNTQTSGTRYAISSLAPNTVFSAIDYNDYYSTGSLGFIGTPRTDLAGIQSGFGGNTNSKTVQPVFISASDLHLHTILNINLNGAATPIAAVPTDIDGNTRNAITPDMGADEFDPMPGLNVGLSALVAPGTNGCYTTTETVTVRLTNSSIDPIDFSIDNVTVNVTATGGYNSTLVLTSGTLATGASMNVTMPATIDMSVYGSFTFNGSATVVGDIYTPNDAMPATTRTSIAPAIGIVSVGSPAGRAYCIVAGRPVLNLSSSTGGVIQWQESTVSGTGPWSNVGTDSLRYTVATDITVTTYYRAQVSCGANIVTSNVDTVTFNNPSVVSTLGGSRCGTGSVTLTATGSAGSTLNWYADASGGVSLGTGPSFATPSISATTTFYVSASQGGGLNELVGKTTSSGVDGSFVSAGYGIVFDATTNFTIASSVIHPVGTGDVTFALYNSAGTELFATSAISVTGTGIATPVTVPLNISVTPGTGYRLLIKSFTGLTGIIRDFTGLTYPYNSPSGAMSVVGSWNGGLTTGAYYFHYNINITSGCSSARTGVVASVTAAPAIVATATPSAICLGESSNLTVTSDNTGYTYGWMPGSLVGPNHTVTPAATTTYTVTATDNSAGPFAGCILTATATVTVNPVPAPVVITPTAPVVCVTGGVTLTAVSGVANPGPVSSYVFATSTGATLDPMTGATQLVASANDDTPTGTSSPIGFTFNYNNTNYTDFSTSPDGWILMGTGAATSEFTNSVVSTSNTPKIYPYWDDLATGSDGNVSKLLTGSAPNRILKIQWQVRNPRLPLTDPSNTTFQLWLYESSNKIEFRYGTMPANANTASVGLTGGATNFQSITISSNTASNSVADDVNAGQPESGRMYTFTLPVIANPITWSPATFLNTTSGSTVISTPTSSITYTATATLGTCTSFSTVTVNISDLSVSATGSNVLCNGGSTGIVTATATGGTAPYEYSINGTTWQSSNVFNVAAGSYTIYVRDSNTPQCTVTGNTVVITEPTVLVNTITGSTDPLCNNAATGSLTSVASGGTSPYTYVITGPTVNATGLNSGVFTGLLAGSYTVTATDANGCTAISAEEVLDNPAAPALSASNSGPICAGQNATLTATPGTYVTYMWTGPGTINNANTAIATAVTPANGDVFSVTITDANGCTNTATTTVTVNPNLAVSVSLSVSPSSEICSGAEVTFTATPTNGGATPNYQFFVNAISVQNGSSPTYVSSTIGDQNIVTVVLTSSEPCTTGNPATSNAITMTVSGIVFADVTLAASPSSTVCAGTSVTYTATPVAGGPTPTYEFFVNNISVQNSTSDSYTYIPAHGHQIYVVMTSSFDCAIGSPATSATITMTVNPTPVAPVITAGGPTTFCAGGSVLLSSDYAGVGNQWYLDNAAISGATSQTYSATASGSYTVVYTALGCPSAASNAIVLTVNANPTASISGSNTYCSALSTTLTAVATAGSGTITSYQWTLNGTTPLGTDPTQEASVAGSYTVTVTNSNNCSTTSAAHIVTVIASPVAGVTADCSTLYPGQTAILTATPSTGVTYEWTLNGGSVLSTANPYTTAPGAFGTYQVKATDGSTGCYGLATIVISAASGPLTGGSSYNIPGGCGSFPSINSAVTYLNANGVTGTGTVTFNVAPGYTETAPAGGIALGSATLNGTTNATLNIVFQKAGAGANPLVTASATQTAGSIMDAVIALVGADYVTFDNINVAENSGNTTTTLATNNMTEFGYALLYRTATDGSQNNTISNAAISLNRTYANTFGVYSNVRHTSTIGTVLADITDPVTGPNSNNKLYSNAISNVNHGIVFIGSATAANMDNGNDIGGASGATGNSLSNFGGLPAASAYIGYPITVISGIYLDDQTGYNVSNNTLVSASVSTTTGLRGILATYTAAPPVAVTNNILSNSVTFAQASTGSIQGITTAGTAPNVTQNTNNNLYINNTVTGNATQFGVANLGGYGTLNITGNVIRGNTSAATTAGFTGVTNQGPVVTAINLNNNFIGNATAGAISYSVATSGTIAGLTNTSAATGAALSISNNDIRGIVQSPAGTNAHVYISNSSAAPTVLNFNSNTFTNLTANTTGSITFMANAVSMAATAVSNMNNNSIVTAFSKTGVGGTITIHTTNSSTPAGAVVNFQNNNFSNITFTGATTFTGYNNTDGGAPTKVITGNTISNITGGSNAITGMTLNFNGTGTNISNNTVTTITGTGAITGIAVGTSAAGSTSLTVSGNTVTSLSSTGTGGSVTGITSGTPALASTVSGNTVNTLSSTGASSTVTGMAITGASAATATLTNNVIHTLTGSGITSPIVNGITVSLGTTVNVSRNKVYNLRQTAAITTTAGAVNGILLSGGTTVNVFNNLIGDLKAPLAVLADAIRGISVTSTTSTTTFNVSYNSIYLNATSTGANFGTSGMFHAASATATTAALNLRNNIVVNASTANGTGFNVAYRRSSTALGNYGATSNNNLFYAGTPSAANLISYDGTNSYQTLANHKTAMATRDQQSVTENPPFLSTTGSDPTFLHIDPTISTQVEGGAENIAGITTDYDNDIRQGNPGYTGTSTTKPDIGADEMDGTPPPCSSASGGTATAAAFTCTSNTATVITATGATSGGGITYQWQVSGTAGGPYTNVVGGSGATTTAYTTPTGLAVGTYYYVLMVTCSNGPLTGLSTEVTIVVRPTPTASATNSGPVCSGTNITLSGTTDIGNIFAWSGPGGYTSTQQSPTFSAPVTGSGTYTFTATLNGCSASGTTVIVINETPTAVVVTPSSISLCEGSIQALVASGGGLTNSAPLVIFTENFNAPTNSWSTVNNSTLGTPAAAAWTLRPSGFVPSETLVTADASQFYLSNSDAQGSGSTTATELISPAFSTTGYGTANIVLNHYYRGIAGSTALVEASTDGTTWTTLDTYSLASVGTAATFANTSVSLTAPFLNQASVYLRFKYDAGWGWYWAINNVTVSSPVSGTFTWTPVTDLYSNPAATIPYAGENLTTVYTKPLTSQTYTATASNGVCVSSATANIVLNPLPNSATITGSATVCQNTPAPNITFTAATGTAPYTFTYNINGGPDQTVTSLSGANPVSVTVPVPTGTTGTFIYTLTAISDIYCSNTASGSATVVVNPAPTVSFTGLASPYCVNAASVTLTGNHAPLGTFSGPGITDLGNGTATFSPAGAGSGTHSITYTHSIGSCSVSDIQSVTVNALPVVSFTTLAASYCADGASVTLTGSHAPLGTFSGPGITDNGNGTASFNPVTAGVGAHAIVYTYTDVTTGCTGTSTQTANVIVCANTITVNLKVFLQGYYVGANTMAPVLLNQATGLSTTQTDTVYMELHDATTFALVSSTTGILMTNGTLVGTFNQAPGNFYIAIKHRNTIQTWSANPVACSASTPLYDFTSSASQAMGDNQILMEPGVWAFFTGDLNQDDFIDGTDYPLFDTDSFNGVNGVYAATDMNGDGFVDGTDYPIFDVNSFNGVSAIHP